MKNIKAEWVEIAHSVDVMGRLFVLPSEAKWVAVDANGEVYGYELEPSYYRSGREWVSLRVCDFLGTISMEEGYNWKEMIMEIEDEV